MSILMSLFNQIWKQRNSGGCHRTYNLCSTFQYNSITHEKSTYKSSISICKNQADNSSLSFCITRLAALPLLATLASTRFTSSTSITSLCQKAILSLCRTDIWRMEHFLKTWSSNASWKLTGSSMTFDCVTDKFSDMCTCLWDVYLSLNLLDCQNVRYIIWN